MNSMHIRHVGLIVILMLICTVILSTHIASANSQASSKEPWTGTWRCTSASKGEETVGPEEGALDLKLVQSGNSITGELVMYGDIVESIQGTVFGDTVHIVIGSGDETVTMQLRMTSDGQNAGGDWQDNYTDENGDPVVVDGTMEFRLISEKELWVQVRSDYIPDSGDYIGYQGCHLSISVWEAGTPNEQPVPGADIVVEFYEMGTYPLGNPRLTRSGTTEENGYCEIYVDWQDAKPALYGKEWVVYIYASKPGYNNEKRAMCQTQFSLTHITAQYASNAMMIGGGHAQIPGGWYSMSGIIVIACIGSFLLGRRLPARKKEEMAPPPPPSNT